MRIISKFRDYYDSGAAYGIDPKIVYVRKEEKKDSPIPANDLISVLGFCGELIPFVDYNWIYSSKIQHANWLLFDDQIWKRKLTKEENWIIVKGGQRKYLPKYYWKNRDEWRANHIRQQVEYIRSNCKIDPYKILRSIMHGNRPTYSDIFKTFKCPIWLIPAGDSRKSHIILNPQVTNILARQYDAIQAFQMISQFIANMNATSQMPEPQPITEKQNLERRGMDDKSFKRINHPGKPRGNKNA